MVGGWPAAPVRSVTSDPSAALLGGGQIFGTLGLARVPASFFRARATSDIRGLTLRPPCDRRRLPARLKSCGGELELPEIPCRIWPTAGRARPKSQVRNIWPDQSFA